MCECMPCVSSVYHVCVSSVHHECECIAYVSDVCHVCKHTQTIYWRAYVMGVECTLCV